MTDLQAPIVPHIDGYGVLDLDRLAGQDLQTRVELHSAPQFEFVHLVWRGTLADGSIRDVFPPPAQIVNPDQVVSFVVNHAEMQALDQGTVLYSYSIQPSATYEHELPESRRTTFLVGARNFAGAGSQLMVIKEAHEQQFNADDAISAGAAVTVAPWQAMRAGDRVTLNWRGFAPNGREYPFQDTWVVEQSHLERRLAMRIPIQYLLLADGGWGLLNYWIDYVGGGKQTISSTQRFELLPAPAGRLPPLTIVEQVGDILDPDTLPAVLTYDVEPYADIQEGDVLVVYAQARINTSTPDQEGVLPSSPTRLFADLLPAIPVASVRFDRSSVDSAVLHCEGPSNWIEQYLDQEVILTYHLARPGLALASAPLTLPVVRSMSLPPPIVEGASGAGQDTGEFRAEFTQQGIRIWVPSEAKYPPDASVQMHWQGFGAAGSAVVSIPEPGLPLAFIVPAQAVMPNLGKAVRVYYGVTPLIGQMRESRVFTLNIISIPENRFPLLHCAEADATTRILRLSRVGQYGAQLTVAPWLLIAQGQRVEMQAAGTHKTSGLAVTHKLLEDHPISAPEVASGLHEALPKAWLADLQHNAQLTLTVRVSADEGGSWALFPRVYLTVDTQS